MKRGRHEDEERFQRQQNSYQHGYILLNNNNIIMISILISI